MRNYFNYFTEIEERFQQRRGSLLLLSTIDWALIETWREAGVPDLISWTPSATRHSSTAT